MNFLQRFFTKRKIFLGIVCVFGILVSFTIPHFAHAGWTDFLTPTGILSAVLGGLIYVVNYILSFVYMFASFFVNVAMNFNQQILSEDNELLKVGWRITRDIANLGFVIAIVVMAFATIIRVESYDSKKLLTRLIAAAILVNFSLAIPGVLITFTNSITNFFLGGSTSVEGGIDLATKLSSSFNPQRLILTQEDPPPPDPSEHGGSLSGFNTALLMSMASLIFGAIFTLVASIVMFILAIMLMVRYLILTFLLILAPLTWFFWVIPDLQSLFSQWWNKFFKWAFFGPASSFFIYLAIQSLGMLGNSSMNEGKGFFGPLENIMEQGMQMLIVTGVLMGGIIVAEKIGLEGGQAAVGAMKAGSKAAAKFVGKQSLRGAKGIGRGIGREFGGLDKKMEEWNQLGGIRGYLGKKYVKNELGKYRKTTIGGAKNLWKKGKGAFMSAAETTGADTLGKDVWKGMKEGSGLFKKEEKKDLPNSTEELLKILEKTDKEIEKLQKRSDEDGKKKLKELQGKRNQILSHYSKMKEEEVLSAGEEGYENLIQEIANIQQKPEDGEGARTSQEKAKLQRLKGLAIKIDEQKKKAQTTEEKINEKVAKLKNQAPQTNAEPTDKDV